MSLSDVIANYQASFVAPLSDPIGTDGYTATFAKRVFPADPKERRMYLKYNFIKQAADAMGAELKAVYQPGEEELGVINHLQSQFTQAAFEQWVWQMHDPPRDPGMGWVFANNFPEQRQRMIDLLNLKHDILEQLMVLKTKSFPDQEDALLLFVINTMTPTNRQRFLTWLVGNDRSPEVLKAIVGPQPIIGPGLREHNTFANGIIKNAAGRPKGSELTDKTGNYPSGEIPNRLWSRMSNTEATEEAMIFRNRIYQNAHNRSDVVRLFDQLPIRGRNDYTKATPYTANTYTDGNTATNKLWTIAPQPDERNVNYYPMYWFQSQKGFDNQIQHILSGLKSNDQ